MPFPRTQDRTDVRLDGPPAEAIVGTAHVETASELAAFLSNAEFGRGLEAALRTLDVFGIDLEVFTPEQHLRFVGQVQTVLGAAGGVESLAEGSTLDLETYRDESRPETRPPHPARGASARSPSRNGDKLTITSTSPPPKAGLREASEPYKSRSFRPTRAVSSSRAASRAARTVQIALVPADQGGLIVPCGLEDGSASFTEVAPGP